MLQQFTKVETADSAQALCQFCREEQRSSEPRRWITRANSPPLFFHEFLNRHRFPQLRYTPESSQSSGEWGSVTEDSGRVRASEHWKKGGIDGRTREAQIKAGRSQRRRRGSGDDTG